MFVNFFLLITAFP